MLKIASAHLWVHDQDVALKYWTDKVGMEVRQDVSLPELHFRWLTVGPPGQDDVSIVLMAIPGPPVMDDATRDQVREVMAKGFGGTAFLTLAFKRACAAEAAASCLLRRGESTGVPRVQRANASAPSCSSRQAPMETMVAKATFNRDGVWFSRGQKMRMAVRAVASKGTADT